MRAQLRVGIIATTVLLAVTACSGPGGQDVSAEGRIDYACALITEVKENHGPVESWDLNIGPEADPAMDMISAAAGLAGAVTGGGGDDIPDEMADAAAEIYKGLAQLKPEVMDGGIDQFYDAC